MKTLVLSVVFCLASAGLCLAASDSNEKPSREDQVRQWVSTRVHQSEKTPTYIGELIQVIRSKKALRKIESFGERTNVLLDFPFPLGDYQHGTIVPPSLIAHGRRYVVVAKEGVEAFWLAQVDDDTAPTFYRADLAKLRAMSEQ